MNVPWWEDQCLGAEKKSFYSLNKNMIIYQQFKCSTHQNNNASINRDNSMTSLPVPLSDTPQRGGRDALLFVAARLAVWRHSPAPSPRLRHAHSPPTRLRRAARALQRLRRLQGALRGRPPRYTQPTLSKST